MDITPKEAHVYKGASLESVLRGIEILEKELSVLYFIKREMVSEGVEHFEPTAHGFKEYVPEQGVK